MIYTVKEVLGSKPYNSKFGAMIDYNITVTLPDGMMAGPYSLSQKETSPAPTVGQQIDGFIEQTNFGEKLKKTPNSYGGGGTAGSRPSGGGYSGKGSSGDKNQDSIERQVALKAAVELVRPMMPDHAAKLESDPTKTALTDLFEHCLALIQTGPPSTGQVRDVATGQRHDVDPGPPMDPLDAFPGATEVPPATQAQVNECRQMYVAAVAKDPGLKDVFANKLTSMNLTSASDADATQADDLIAFLRERL